MNAFMRRFYFLVRSRREAVLALAMIFLSLAGCAVQRRERLPALAAAPVWQKATLEQLLEKISAQESFIQTLEATVELQPSVTRLRTEEILYYRDVRAFILVRKPAFLRMIGQAPVVRNTLFDMASDGETFRLYIPSRNRFIMGKSQGGRRSESPLENLRPQHILDALLWKAPAEGEQAVLEAAQVGDKAYYVVHVLRRSGGEHLLLARNFWVERPPPCRSSASRFLMQTVKRSPTCYIQIMRFFPVWPTPATSSLTALGINLACRFPFRSYN